MRFRKQIHFVLSVFFTTTRAIQANLIVYGGVVVSVVSTVSLVLLNKWIFERDGFQFMATLTGFHFGFTYLATRLLLGADFFEYKEPEGGTAKVIPVAIGSLCSVLFMNMNLAYNSVCAG